jgi:hypothetical protein
VCTRNLKPEDRIHEAAEGTKLGFLRKREMLANFKKIARGKNKS